MSLYPGLSDEDFADSHAQTVTFALLLARVHGIEFDGKHPQGIAEALAEQHPLMGRALAVLGNEAVEGSVGVTAMLRLIGAVKWDQFGIDSNAYVDLFEHFHGRV